MRTSILAAAGSALATVALVAGAGTAAAEESEVPGPRGSIPERLLSPAIAGTLGGLGYGSAGTGSLMDLVTGVINFGSTTLSVDVPSSVGSTGFYAPGSFGSYGPMAPVGEVLTASVSVVGGSF